ncbi:MAG: ABC transporter ATP-binding protein [Oscillospiraceae bacterium]|nr:ABC transporter ATP-binding protein [Oscillospiraceae bacterium]
MLMDFALKVNGVTIKYSSNYNSDNSGNSRVNIAVKNVSFIVENGDYCCIVGMNGSGKSSLIKGILGLAPISSGTIDYGVERGEISYLPQINSIPVDFPATVKEIALTGAQKKSKGLFSAFYSKDDVKSANYAMERLKITGLAKKRFGELSGGQQQKVLLARALCKNPKLLILDEPCAGLDNNTVDSFYELLYDLNNKHKVTVLMITHDLHDVQKYAKHIIEMDAGILFYGTAKEWEERGN